MADGTDDRASSPAPATNPDAGAARAAAIAALAKWLRTGVFPSRAVSEGGALSLSLVGGVLRNLTALDFALSGFVAKKPDPITRAALYAGAWQLLFERGVPAYAAVNETVAAAKRLRVGSPAFVNAVLRNVVRNAAALAASLARAPLSVRLSHPEALVRRWTDLFGATAAEAICAADNEPPCVTAAPVPEAAGGDAEAAAARLAARWQAAGLDAAPDGPVVRIPRGVGVEGLPGYAEGAFIVQDRATLEAVEMLAPRPGETVLDCCAAPGGKTVQIAARVGASGRVLAFDDAERRLGRLRENIARTHLADRVETGCCDAASPALRDLLAGRRVDAVLADVPCSNSGVFGRRPEARWRWSEAETRRLAAVQLAILRNVAGLGAGRIVYSTCSIDPLENGDVVAAFLQSAEGRRYALVRDGLLLPGRQDGAYAALLVLK